MTATCREVERWLVCYCTSPSRLIPLTVIHPSQVLGRLTVLSAAVWFSVVGR